MENDQADTTRLTIGFDAKRAAQNRTGLGNYSRFVIRGLSRLLPQAKLLLYIPNPRKKSALEQLDSKENISLRTPVDRCWQLVRSIWRVWGLTRDLQRDGVHIYHGLSNELPLNINRAKDIKTIVTIHDLIFLRYPQYYKPIDRWIYRYKFRRACEQADHIVAVSECTKRDIMQFFGTPSEKISVIYQGCDEQFRQPATHEKKQEVRRRYQLPDRYILYVGSIEERKNLLLLAKALAHISDPNITVIAVGKQTPYAKNVQAFIDEHRLGHRFHMLSGVPFADLPALYQLATVFVYPSRFEGFGIPLLEALCSGTPAIGCTGSCLEEAGGPSSLYVDPDNAPALAHTIDQLLSDENLRQQMANDGQQYAERFKEEPLARSIVNLYRQILG